MPDFTIASAIDLIMSSLTLQANLFQLFHPMGGVSASLEEMLSWAVSGIASENSVNITRMTCFDDMAFLRRNLLTFVSEERVVRKVRDYAAFSAGTASVFHQARAI